MEQKDIRNAVLSHLAAAGSQFVPAGISARHVHLSQGDLDRLFGPGYSLRPRNPLSQPGQFAAEERLDVLGPKGELKGVRVLGPVRRQTQVELGVSDLIKVGIAPLVRMSGDLDGTPGCTLRGPAGQVTLSTGVIAAARHLHLSPFQASCYGLRDGQAVSLRADGPRPGVLEQVICRVGEGHDLEVHLDTDEANAFGITNGTLLEVLGPADRGGDHGHSHGCGGCSGNCSGHCACHGESGKSAPTPPPAVETEPMDLVTERDVQEAWQKGIPVIRCLPRCIITDAARERAMSLGIEIKR